MIIGIGLDVCEISRMNKQLESERFLNRFFTAAEAEYIRSRGKCAAETLAGLFAAREALGKALGCGIGFELKEAEIRHTESGAPYYCLSGSLKDRVGNNRLHLSVTHDGGVAAAVCNIEGEDCK